MTASVWTTWHRVENIDAALSSSRNLVSNSRGAPQSKETGQMGHWVARMRVEIAMMRTPDGHNRLDCPLPRAAVVAITASPQ